MTSMWELFVKVQKKFVEKVLYTRAETNSMIFEYFVVNIARNIFLKIRSNKTNSPDKLEHYIATENIESIVVNIARNIFLKIRSNKTNSPDKLEHYIATENIELIVVNCQKHIFKNQIK